MDLLMILLIIFGSLLALFLIYYLMKTNKKYLIPTLIFVLFGFTLILLSQNIETGGGFLDVIYMLFGIFSIIVGVIVGLVILVVRQIQAKK
ncbi:MAG: hypothetical protein Q7I99_07805 [Acholeplasmataceae bacterium]|nr:hypothetical protein [Acholeplasmataceae bacterium]